MHSAQRAAAGDVAKGTDIYMGICKVIVRFCVRCTDVARAVVDDTFYMYMIVLVRSCL